MTPRLVHLCGVAIAVVLTLMASTGVGAEDAEKLLDRLTEEEQAEVAELIEKGRAAYDAGDFEVSVEHFHDVYELFPHPNVSYRLGLSYERIGDAEMAIQHLRRFLELDPEAPERGRIERTIADLEEQLGDDISTLRVESFPVGAQIYIGDRETASVGETPQQVTLEPGEHRVFIEKRGYEPTEETVVVEEGTNHVVQVHLDEIEDDDGGGRPVDDGLDWWKPAVSVGLLGLGGFSLYQAVAYMDEADRIRDRIHTQYGGEPDTPQNRSERDELNDELTAASNMSTAMGVTGGVLLMGSAVFTLWWIVAEYRTGLALRVDPGGDGAGVWLRGEF